MSEENSAEQRALYVVAATFFLLAGYIAYDSIIGLIRHAEPLISPVGTVLAAVSLLVMPALAFAKQQVAEQMGSTALVADSQELGLSSSIAVAPARSRSLHVVRLVIGRPDWRARHAAHDRLARLGDTDRSPRT